MINKSILKLGICMVLLPAVLLSGCGRVENPDPSVTPIPSPSSTISPSENQILSEEETLLYTHFGLVFPETTDVEMKLKLNSVSENSSYIYDYTEFTTYVDPKAVDGFDGSGLDVSATITAYDHEGNEIKDGMTSLESAKGVLHTLRLTYPGKYHVTYTVNLKPHVSDFKMIDIEGFDESYIIEKTYEIEKPEAFISVESDFYFVESESNILPTLDFQILTSKGENIRNIVEEDILSSCDLQLAVPILATRIDKSSTYPLDVMGKKGDDILPQEEVCSNFFELVFVDSFRYIMPRDDEKAVKTFYNLMNESMDYADYATLDLHVQDYENFSEGQKFLFSVYPKFLETTRQDYTSFYEKRDAFYIYKFNQGRIHLANELQSLIAEYENSINGKEKIAQDIIQFISSLSTEPIFLLDVPSYTDSDLAFVVKFNFNITAFDEAQQNDYVRIALDKDGVYEITAPSDQTSSYLVNDAVGMRESAFNVYVCANEIFIKALRSESIEESFFDDFLSHYSANSQSEELDSIKMAVDFVHSKNDDDEKFLINDHIAKALHASNNKLHQAYDNLFDFQAENFADIYTDCIAEVESYLIRYSAYEDVMNEYDLSMYKTTAGADTLEFAERLLGFDFATYLGTSCRVDVDLFESHRSESLGYMIMHSPLVYVKELKENFIFWLGRIIDIQNMFDAEKQNIIAHSISMYDLEFYDSIMKVYPADKGGFDKKGGFVSNGSEYTSKFQYYFNILVSKFKSHFPWDKVDEQNFDKNIEESRVYALDQVHDAIADDAKLFKK